MIGAGLVRGWQRGVSRIMIDSHGSVRVWDGRSAAGKYSML